MKIKIIDLFNMSSKKEKMPEKIKYDLKEYFYCGYDYKICDVEKQFDDDYNLWNNLDMYKLNDYVEIVEEDKKLEKIDFRTLNTQKEKNRAMKDTINQLIDEINKLKENK